MIDRIDLSLADDLDEVRSEVQRRVDRVIAARVELGAAIADLNDGRAQVLDKSAAAVAYVDAFMNPLAANPPPLVPEVAAPTPEVEPPVFTEVTTIEAAPVNTSGGSAPVAEDVPVVLPVEVATEAAIEADPVPVELAVIVEEGVIAVEGHNAAIEVTENVFVENGGEALVQVPPKGDPDEVAEADAANIPGLNGDPVGKPEGV